MNNDVMKAAAPLFLSLLMAGCSSQQAAVAPETITSQFNNPCYGAGALVPSDRAKATDILVLSFEVDDLILGCKMEACYRRLREQEHVPYSARVQSLHADCKGGSYTLSLQQSKQGPVTGDTVEFIVDYRGTMSGQSHSGEARIVVSTTGRSGGKAGNVTYRSEWRPNPAQADATRPPADPDH